MESFGDVEAADHNKVAQKAQLIEEQLDGGGNSLEESIKDTVRRDLETILSKLRFFFNFNVQANSHIEHEVRNYDLWGPFVFFLLFAVTSSLHQDSVEAVFTVTIMVLTFGAFVLTLNAKLLGVNLSMLQG